MYRVPKKEPTSEDSEDVVNFNTGSNEMDIKNLLQAVLRGQKQIHKSIGELEELVSSAKVDILELQMNVEGIEKKQDKMRTEVDRISHRSSVTKDLMTKTAAHTLNMARKINGGYSVHDPVKDFLAGGYKDWSLNLPVAPFEYMQIQNMFQANGYPFQSVEYEQQIQAYQESQGLRTPVYVEPDLALEKTATAMDKLVIANDNSMRPSTNRFKNGSRRTSRFKPYSNKNKDNNCNTKGKNVTNQNRPSSSTDSPYVPESPNYST